MWAYKIRYLDDDNYDSHDAEGLVAGASFTDCYTRLEMYYGKHIVELTIHALDSEDGVLDFEPNECGLKYENFVQKKS